jgi:hypothetical protein
MPSPLFNSLAKQYGTGVSGGGSPLFRSLQQKYGGSVSQPPKQPDQLFSGNAFMDVIDTLQVPQYALVGGVHKAIEGGNPWEGVKQGVKGRASWRDVLNEHTDLASKKARVLGVDVSAADAVGTVMDIFIDPLNVIPVGKIAGVVGKGIGKGADVLGVTKVLKATPAPEALLKLIDKVSDIPLKGRTIGEVVDRIANDTPLLQKLLKIEDARIIEASKLAEPATEVVGEMRKVKQPVRKLLYQWITAGDDAAVKAADAVKEPWEMMREEFGANYNLRGVGKTAYSRMADTGGLTEPALKSLSDWDASAVKRYGSLPDGEVLVFRKKDIPGWDNLGDRVVPNGVTPVMRLKGVAEDPHKAIVRQAIESGKRVPADVLAEYPDLAAVASKGLSPTRAAIADSTADGLRVYRRDMVGSDLTAAKPHGLYTSIVDDPTTFVSPHVDVGDADFAGVVKPRNPLEVSEVTVKHPRFGGFESGHASSGVSALKNLVSNEEFDRLLGMRKSELVELLSKEFPGPDYSRYYDSYELLEAYAAQLARKHGYDAIIMRTPRANMLTGANFDEAVLLTDDIGKMAVKGVSQSTKRAGLVEAAVKQGVKAEDFTRLATQGSEIFPKLKEELQALGAMGEGQANYLPRLFQMFEDPDTFVKNLAKTDPEKALALESKLTEQGFKVGSGAKIKDVEMGFLQQRKDLPEEMLQGLGHIEDAPYAIAKGAAAQSGYVAKVKFLNNVSSEFAKDFATEGQALANGYVKMADDVGWGALKGKYVPEVVARKLQDAAAKPTEMAALLRKGVGWWKYGKVVANPATHVRNSLTNMALVDWGAGLTPLTPKWFKYVGQAARSLASKDELFKEAKGAGTFLIDTFANRELPNVLREATEDLTPNKLTGLFGWLKATGKKAGDLYEAEEQLGKLTLYLAKRDEFLKTGMDAGTAASKAAEEAEKWLFNYRKVPKWVDMMRNPRTAPGFAFSSPFITFTYKAAPRVAETVLTNPTRLTKYFKIGRGVESLADQDETSGERRVMPEWMKNGLWMKLPVKDKYGRSMYLDGTYLMPLADLTSSQVIGPGQKPVFMAMPFNNMIMDLMRNQSAFTGKPIVAAGLTQSQAAKAVGDYLGGALLPALAPGGYGFRNITDAVAKKPDWLGRTRALGAVLTAQIAGLKTRPVEYGEEAMSRSKEFEDELRAVQFNMQKVMVSPAISDKEKEHIWNEGMERINGILEQMNETFAAPATASPVL